MHGGEASGNFLENVWKFFHAFPFAIDNQRVNRCPLTIIDIKGAKNWIKTLQNISDISKLTVRRCPIRTWFWRNYEDLAWMFCNSIDFLCRFYVFLYLNLLNFVKITYACENAERYVLNRFVYISQCFKSNSWHSFYLWSWMDIYYPIYYLWTGQGRRVVPTHSLEPLNEAF